MIPVDKLNATPDPIDILDEVLECVWHTIADAYDVKTDLPDTQTLFNDVDLGAPNQAAQMVLVNMLLEAIGCIGRFSPWYTQPARAFGLRLTRDPDTQCVRWSLAPEALQKWQKPLESLTSAIRDNSGFIQIAILVDGLMSQAPPDEPCLTANCQCTPPRSIEVKRSVLDKAKIICDVCQQPFCAGGS